MQPACVGELGAGDWAGKSGIGVCERECGVLVEKGGGFNFCGSYGVEAIVMPCEIYNIGEWEGQEVRCKYPWRSIHIQSHR